MITSRRWDWQIKSTEKRKHSEGPNYRSLSRKGKKDQNHSATPYCLAITDQLQSRQENGALSIPDSTVWSLLSSTALALYSWPIYKDFASVQAKVCQLMTTVKLSFTGVSSRGFHTHGHRQGCDARTRNKWVLLLCNPGNACATLDQGAPTF